MSSGCAVARRHCVAHEAEIKEGVDTSEPVVSRHMIVEPEPIKHVRNLAHRYICQTLPIHEGRGDEVAVKVG